MARRRPLLPMAAWVLGLGALLAVLDATGHGALAPPTLTAPGTWAAWLAPRTAPEAAMALVRLALVAWAWYLLAVTLVAVAVRIVGSRHLVAVADRVTVPFVRRIVRAGVGAGLVGATVAAAGGVALAGPVRAEVTVTVDTDPRPVAGASDDVAPVMQRLDDAPPPEAARTWTVAPGDHLWSISERVLAAAWGRAPAEGELVPFWQRVVAGNRDRLADPDNADLIYPGQVLALPDLPHPG
jgi:hypothetical protein